MTKKRQQFSNEFKAKVALEALKGHKTVSEIASEFEIHPTQVNNWKKHLLSGAADTFSKNLEKKVSTFLEGGFAFYPLEGGRVCLLRRQTGHPVIFSSKF